MNKYQLKHNMQRDKGFLSDLYLNESDQRRKILKNATKSEIKTLVFVIHFLVKGEIKIKAAMFEKIKHSKKLNLLNEYFSEKKSLQTILNWKAGDLLTLLFKFLNIYHPILFPLFNKL